MNHSIVHCRHGVHPEWIYETYWLDDAETIRTCPTCGVSHSWIPRLERWL